jgi:hypothetical protein
VIHLYRDSDGELRFPNSAVARSPRLRRYVEQKRLEGERQHAEHERLHAEHMPLPRGGGSDRNARGAPQSPVTAAGT